MIIGIKNVFFRLWRNQDAKNPTSDGLDLFVRDLWKISTSNQSNIVWGHIAFIQESIWTPRANQGRLTAAQNHETCTGVGVSIPWVMVKTYL